MIQFVAQRLMDLDVETLCGAACGERSAEVGRNGYLMPKEAHIYQMQAYASMYPCKHFALIYPSHSGLGEAKPTAFSLRAIAGRKPIVSVVCIDLTSDAFAAKSIAIGSALERLLGLA